MFNAGFGGETSIEDVEPAILHQWAGREPAFRYPILGKCVNMFRKKHGEEETDISPLFLSLLDHAPHKRQFLGGVWDKLHPQSWSRSK